MTKVGNLMVECLLDQAEPVRGVAPHINSRIVSAELTEDRLTLSMQDNAGKVSSVVLVDHAQSCCERRYIVCDDNVQDLVGHKLLGIYCKPAPDIPAGGDVHEVMFVEVQTDSGFISMTTHNEHNGYYGGFALQVF